MSVTAAGAIFVSKSTKRILLNFRSENSSKPNCFGFWGGKLDFDENVMDGLSREIVEELGFIPTYDRVIVIDEYISPDGFFKYYSFAIIVQEEFIPKINHESQGYAWCSMDHYPKPLHPGARAILDNKSVKQSLLRLLDSETGSNFPVRINSSEDQDEATS